MKNKTVRPPVDKINLEWIDSFQKQFNITDYELSLQLAQERTYLYHIRAGKMKITKGIKAAIWHYYKRLEKNQNPST